MVSKRKYRLEDIVLIALVLIAVAALVQMINVRNRYRNPAQAGREHELVLLNAKLDPVTHTLACTVLRHTGFTAGLRNAAITVDLLGPGHTLLQRQRAGTSLWPGNLWHFEIPAPVSTSEFAVTRLALQ